MNKYLTITQEKKVHTEFVLVYFFDAFFLFFFFLSFFLLILQVQHPADLRDTSARQKGNNRPWHSTIASLEHQKATRVNFDQTASAINTILALVHQLLLLRIFV